MDPEQRFLQARQARLKSASSSNTTISTRNEELSIFWSELRRRLKQWTDRLEDCCGYEEDVVGGTINTTINDTVDRRGSLRQELLDLKEELQALRQHCLHAGTTATTTTSTTHVSSSTWSVPTELPNADLRLLHAEFTRCSTRWEIKHEELFPKGKFTFRRYRAELARRKALGIPLEEAAAPAPARKSSSSTIDQKDTKTVTPPSVNENGTLEHISNSIIRIFDIGTVQIREINDEGDPVSLSAVSSSKGQSATMISPQRISSAAVLLRNVQNCTVQIDKPLEALHLVDTSDVTVMVSQPIASSIHITNCHQCQVTAQSSQQLRIHESTHLRFQVPLGAGAILEDSTNLVFMVVAAGNNNSNSDHSLDIKDFNWLRTGVPSPNFRIEILTEKEAKPMGGLAIGDERSATLPLRDDQNNPKLSNAATSAAAISPSVGDPSSLPLSDNSQSSVAVESSTIPKGSDDEDDDEL